MTFVLSHDLVPLLDPTIDRIGIEGLAKRARAVERFVKGADAYYRRITDIRADRAVTIDAHMADVLLLACDDDPGRLALLPHFPKTRSEAFQMVETHFELRGEQIARDELAGLAESLVHFTTGLRDQTVESSDAALARRETERRSHPRRMADKQALAA